MKIGLGAGAEDEVRISIYVAADACLICAGARVGRGWRTRGSGAKNVVVIKRRELSCGRSAKHCAFSTEINQNIIGDFRVGIGAINKELSALIGGAPHDRVVYKRGLRLVEQGID